MSNGLAKLVSGHREAREVDLLADFHAAWLAAHTYKNELRKSGKSPSKDENDKLLAFAEQVAEAHLALEYYRGRHERH